MAHIELSQVSLSYPVYGTQARSLKATALSMATGGFVLKEERCVKIESLKDISLEISNGDRVGLIGHNGSGKTTLLKVLAQIYEPTSGTVRCNGQISCLFDLMVGLDAGLTGYENILLRALLLGLSKREAVKIVPEVMEFSELGEFLHLPLKTYSAGMLIRLGFGIMTSLPAEILLVDEIVGVGDARFMEKAKARMKNRIHQSDILVLSSHDFLTIREFCNKVLLLEKGRLKYFGRVDSCDFS